ncbi:MAG TPA: helix-turn-helix transcriptional regulator [Actinocrinis sp.]
MTGGGAVYDGEEQGRAALAVLLRELRESAPPERFGGTGRVTQAQVAYAIRVTETYYRRMERGQAPVTRPTVEALVSAHQLEGASKLALYRLALGWEPDVTVAVTEVDPHTAAIIDALPFPSYLSDPAWTVVHYNALHAAWWPTSLAGENVMRMVLLDPAVRVRLMDWQESWAVPMLAQLRFAQVRLRDPYPARLAKLLEELRRASPDVDRLCDEQHVVYVHPDGDVRGMLCPHGERVEVRILANEPAGYPNYRLISLVPLAGLACSDCVRGGIPAWPETPVPRL